MTVAYTAPPPAVVAPLTAPLTDLGNAERFARINASSVRYVAIWKSWFVWDGQRWRRDDTCEVERRAKEAVRSIWQESANGADKEERSQIAKWAERSESIGRVKAMVDLARAEPGVAIVTSAFDTHPFLFVAANGTIDLETGELLPHRPSDLLTKASAIPYEPEAACPTWIKFLARIFDNDRDLISYVQRAIGYSLTGVTREQCFHVLHGSGQNGKSTFLEVLAHILGEYAIQADFATFIDKQTTNDAPRNDVARLAGARLVRSSEVGEGKRFNEALIKALTGEEVISARFLYSEAFEFKPTFKLWLAANHKPVIRGVDPAIWRRVRLVPFTVAIPDNEKDDTLRDKLVAESPGILAWAVRGCREWLEYRLTAPETVLAATQDYKAESDVIGAFLDDCCETDPLYAVKAGDLYGAYTRWAKDGGEHVLSNTMFGRRIDERGFDVRKNGIKYRVGLRLRDGIAAHNGADSSGRFGGGQMQLSGHSSRYDN
jgi:putative DNA primase/helicase